MQSKRVSCLLINYLTTLLYVYIVTTIFYCSVIEQVKNSCTDYRTLIHLYQTLITFLPENALIALKLNDVKIEPLDVYCCVKRKEDVLNRGLRQLQELNIHFSRLANY